MKRLVGLLLVMVELFCIAGCGKSEPVTETTEETQTVAATLGYSVPVFPEETVPELTEPAPREEVAVPENWVVHCTVSITFYTYPDGSIMGNIPDGSRVELLGWNERYANIIYDGREGYVLAGYLMPEDENYIADCLAYVRPANLYTYWDMLSHIEKLKKQYPKSLSVSSIGTSEQGRDIPVLRIGSADAEHQVLLQGAIHGREYLTAWLLMAMADYWLARGILDHGDVCYHIIPMVNPDGVIISQTRKLNEQQREIYLLDKEKGYTTQSERGYAQDWKANGKGIDLNRNFPSGWEEVDDRDGPSSERYKGVTPFCAAETVALRDYTYVYDFDVTVSYHSSGSIIYYEYGHKEPVNTLSESLGTAVHQVSGYRMANSVGVGGAGYKDWAMDELGIPSLTIEIGSGDSPLTPTESYSTFARNIAVLPSIAAWLQAGNGKSS